ncbi:MAG: holo-ACP synthase [bacterium]|nr:holo-ACP synthase [bacterium]
MVKGIGVDIVDIPRIKKLLDKGDRFLEKVFHETEIRYCQSKHRREVHLAARFASKEAFFKALGTGWRYGMRWEDIVVENDSLGKPVINLSGKTQDYFQAQDFSSIHLSISHTQDYAVAFVVLE